MSCAGIPEDCDHLFRKCKQAKGIWRAVVRRDVAANLEGLNWNEWLLANLSGAWKLGLDEGWPARFATRLWWIWRWRNDEIFRARSRSLDQKIQWLEQQEIEINSAFSKQRNPGSRLGQSIVATVAWKRPPPGSLKLNVDGCRSTRDGIAGCGGLLRDHFGRWVGGFTRKIGVCSVEEAEAWEVFQGLCMATRKGIRSLIAECDSKKVVDSLRGNLQIDGQHNNVLPRCLEVINNFANIEIRHVYHEQNRVADALAKQAMNHNLGLVTIDVTPIGLRDIVSED